MPNQDYSIFRIMLDTRYWILDTRLLLVTGFLLLDTRFIFHIKYQIIPYIRPTLI
jgi:hypothetical protein